MPTYKVLSPIRHLGQRYSIGSVVELEEDEAARLNQMPYPILQPVEVTETKPTVFNPAEPKPGRGGKKPAEHSEVTIPSRPGRIREAPAESAPEAQASTDASLDAGAALEAEPAPEATPQAIKVDINSASVEELAEAFKGVNGIGQRSAQVIVEHRPYASLEDVPDQADLVGIARASWPEVIPLLSIGPDLGE